MTELRADEGFFQTRDNLRLFWRSLAPRDEAAVLAHVVVVHGYGDHCGRYRGVIEHLARAGFHVHAFDYRGHGQSDGRRGHCDAFTQYLDDLEAFLAKARERSKGKKLFVFSHSHGGLMLATYGINRATEGIAGVAFSAPFFRLAFKPPALKVFAAKLIEKVIPFFPFANEVKVGQLSRDLEWQKATERDPLYGHQTTPRWFAEAMRAQLDLLRRAGEFKLPCLVMQGSADPIADPAATREFFDKVSAPDKTFKLYDDFLHEITNEVGKEQVLADLAGWLTARAQGAAAPAQKASGTSPSP